MLHNSTILYHRVSTRVSFKEKRLINNSLWGSIKGAFSGALNTGITAKHKLGAFSKSKPVKGLFFPATWPIKKTWQGLKWGVARIEDGLHIGKELSKSIYQTRDSVGRTLFELSSPALKFVKHNVIDNTRDIFKGIFSTPINVVKNLWKSASESAAEIGRNGIKDTLSNIIKLKPIELIKSTRKALSELIKSPFKAAKSVGNALIETPKKISQNIADSVLAFPRSMKSATEHFRGAYNKVLEAPKKGLESADEVRAKRTAELEKKLIKPEDEPDTKPKDEKKKEDQAPSQ